MGVGDEHCPRLARLEGVAGAAVGAAALTAAPIDERAGVAGVVQHLEDPVVAQGSHARVPLFGPVWTRDGNVRPSAANAFTVARAEPVRAKVANRQAYGVAHALVGVEHDPPGGVIDEADRQGHDSSPRRALVQLAASQPGFQKVQLGF